LQDARGGRLADRDRARDTDDVGHLRLGGAQEVLLHDEQPLCRRHVERQQAREREINLLDLLHVEPVVQRAHARHLVRRQGHRRVFAQRRPLVARERAVRRKAVVGTLFHVLRQLVHPPLRAAFSSSPDWVVRAASAASTSASLMPRASSTTSRWYRRSAVSPIRCSRSSVTAASAVSTASSPSFLAQCATPLSISLRVYDLSGGAAARSCTRASRSFSVKALMGVQYHGSRRIGSPAL